MTSEPRSALTAVGWEMECHAGNSAKYYRFVVAGSCAIFQYGRIGDVQDIIVHRTASALIAQDTAWKQSQAKLRKYELTVDETPFVIDPAWLQHVNLTSSAASSDVRAAFSRAAAAGIRLRGQLVGVTGDRVVALRRWKQQAGNLPADVVAAVTAVAVSGRARDLQLAVLPAELVAVLDARYTPRLAVADLGPALPGDHREILTTTLGLLGEFGDAAEALTAARLVHG